MNRQFRFQPRDLFKGKDYILDFTDMPTLYLEICGDILYVMLNILLAVSIADNAHINSFTGNNEEYYMKLNSIFQTHYKKYKVYYKCQDNLRVYRVNTCVSEAALQGIALKLHPDIAPTDIE